MVKTEEMTDKEALRALLPEMEQTGDRLLDETLGRLLSAFQNRPYNTAQTIVGWHDRHAEFVISVPADRMRYWYRGSRDRCPDVDLSAADTLAREMLPDWFRSSSTGYVPVYSAQCTLSHWMKNKSHYGSHPTSEPMAILIALTRALLQDGERKER